MRVRPTGSSTLEPRTPLSIVRPLRLSRPHHYSFLGLLSPGPFQPLCPAATELPPAVAPGPFSALFPTRFILDDSALYLSDKCEVETLDLRRGGQGLAQAPPTLRGQVPSIPRAARCYSGCTDMHVYAHNCTRHSDIFPW